MILTVSLNPAVDRTCRLGVLYPGNVNRMDSAVNVAGGKAVNVTKVLRQFRMPVASVGFLGGAGGTLILDTLEQLGVECHFTKIAGETRMTINVLEENGRVTEFLEPGPMILSGELKQFIKQFTGCLDNCELVVLSGSLPQGVPTDIYASLIKLCHMSGCQVILDSSGEALRQGVLAGPDLVKPNKKELEILSGRHLDSREEIVRAARELLKFGVCSVVVSLGGEGLFWVDGERELFREAKKVKAVNTVGCGDTVVASLSMSLLAKEGVEMAMDKAAAMAGANASTEENGIIPIDVYLDLL